MVKYLPEGQAEPDTAKTLERDGLIKEEGDGFTVLDANNLRVVCWQLTMNENLRASLGEPFPGGRCAVAQRHPRTQDTPVTAAVLPAVARHVLSLVEGRQTSNVVALR